MWIFIIKSKDFIYFFFRNIFSFSISILKTFSKLPKEKFLFFRIFLSKICFIFPWQIPDPCIPACIFLKDLYSSFHWADLTTQLRSFLQALMMERNSSSIFGSIFAPWPSHVLHRFTEISSPSCFPMEDSILCTFTNNPKSSQIIAVTCASSIMYFKMSLRNQHQYYIRYL